MCDNAVLSQRPLSEPWLSRWEELEDLRDDDTYISLTELATLPLHERPQYHQWPRI